MSTCNQLDLQTLGSQLVMPKNLPDNCACQLTITPWNFLTANSTTYFCTLHHIYYY